MSKLKTSVGLDRDLERLINRIVESSDYNKSLLINNSLRLVLPALLEQYSKKGTWDTVSFSNITVGVDNLKTKKILK